MVVVQTGILGTVMTGLAMALVGRLTPAGEELGSRVRLVVGCLVFAVRVSVGDASIIVHP